MTNLFWPVYKNLELEVIELSNKIHFDDKQTLIYSVKIAELLIRCSVEIEAISKEIFFLNGGIAPKDRDLYFDTDCLDFLEKKWTLSQKKVLVTAVNFYFVNDENKVLTPLNKANKRGTSSADWKRAYQAVKHNRTENLEKGNIKFLLRSMAALFLLNIYYRNEIYDLDNKNSDNFTNNLSEIFNIKVHKWTGNDGKMEYIKAKDFDECTYIVKWTDKVHKKHSEWIAEQGRLLNESIFSHPNVQKHISEKLIENGKLENEKFSSFIQNREYFNLIDMKSEYIGMIQRSARQAAQNVSFDMDAPSKFEAVLNKNQKIHNL